jgi:hypothetical protein
MKSRRSGLALYRVRPFSSSYFPIHLARGIKDKHEYILTRRVTEGLGYVKVLTPEKYNNLPTPLSEYSPTTFTTSMTHQLHCLHAILSVYSGMTSNNTDKMSHDGTWHLTHCFEYLRQSIMCSADLALEGQQTTFPPGFVGSDGWDAKHVCKNYDEVLAYLEGNRQNDLDWI